MMADLSKKRLIHINADGTLDRSFHQPQLDGFYKINISILAKIKYLLVAISLQQRVAIGS